MEANEKLLENYWLNNYVIESLKDQWINVEINWNNLYIDTSNVYHGFLDESWNIISGHMSSLPMVWYKIDYVSRGSDWITTFHLVNTSTGEKNINVFSKDKFENIKYVDQLEFWRQERENAKKRSKMN
jgi:hypothetical protein